MKITDPYSKYHGKIDVSKIVPGYKPLVERRHKKGQKRLTSAHLRKEEFIIPQMLELQDAKKKKFMPQVRENPLPKEYKSILEISTRCPYCPISFVLDVSGGFCSYACRYCFQAKSIESLMTSFFDSDNPMQLRWASQEHVKRELTNILRSRGVEPREREPMKGKCGALSDPKSLKKAVAQRVPLRFGTRSENFLPPERKLKVSLEALKIIKDFDYPLIINTKSEILAEEPWFSTICELGDNVAIQESITHIDDKFSKLIEPGAPSATARWNVLKQFNEVGINAMARMEPCAHFLNADDKHLKAYMEKAEECGVKKFMGDVYHYTANHEEIQNLFYEMGIDFGRMWEATSEFQGLGSLSFEKAMYYAKKKGIKCGTFNYHSIPWNDDPVCCMVGEQFGSWSKYSIVHVLRNEFAENPNTNISFEEFDKKYYGLELHPSIRERIKEVWNMEKLNCFTLDFMEGMIPVDRDSEGNLVWRFEPRRMGEIYDSLIKVFGGKKK